MFLDLCFWIGRHLVVWSLRAQWRRDFYSFGGRAWTGVAR